MNVSVFHKNRLIWIILILMISFGLVSVALAAASSSGNTLTSAPANQTQPEVQQLAPPVQSIPPSPFQTASNQPRNFSINSHAPYVDPGPEGYPLEPIFTVNYAHEWVEGQYDPGYQVSITVTNELGELKATAHGVTGVIPWWGSGTGFSTNYNVSWDGPTPDLQIGDYVVVAMDNGYSNEVRLGEIGGVVDTNADTFQGYLNIPWLTEPVYVQCNVWVNNGPSFGVGLIDPQGTFTCDFSFFGFDLIPGMNVAVSYIGPDHNSVINVFQGPAPDLRVNLEPQGTPAEGNNYSFRLHYNNDGWLASTGVVLTQTFEGMTYLYDTSGFAHEGSGSPGDPVVWQVGDLPYNHNGDSSFLVFVKINNLAGELVKSNAGIYDDGGYYQNDESRKHYYWEAVLAESSSDLAIYKNPWTWGPAPGQDFVYAVNVCSSAGTSTSEVFITDTLPLSTTLINWWSQNPGYVEVSASDHELVVKRATIPEYWCGEVYLNVHLSEQAWPGMWLHNHATVSASSDINPDNNSTDLWHSVSSPNYNLRMNSNWAWGQFVPGGEVAFEIQYSNDGNMPVPGTMVRTTLPAGTEFMYAYTWDWSGWKVITPTITTDEYLVFDIGTFPNGYNANLGIQLKISDDTPPGTPLVVKYTISGDAFEIRYNDNQVVFTEIVNDTGPNLRVDKHTNWHWNYNGDQYYELNYQPIIQNMGTQPIFGATIVDTYPISTTLINCGWNWGPGGMHDCIIDEPNHKVTFIIDRMDPGNAANAFLNVKLNDEVSGIQGLDFVNQVEAPLEGDVAPADNIDTVNSYTGLDVFITKWLDDAELRPGGLVTYTVEFGNLNRWPFNGNMVAGSHVTETLPIGMTFVKAIPGWDQQNTWEPESINGQQVVWGWGPMWSDSAWTFKLVAQIDDDVLPGQFINMIEANNDRPIDIELNPDNNFFEYLLSIPFRLYLPLSSKAP